MKRPIESDYISHVAYTRALEQYCDELEQVKEPVADALHFAQWTAAKKDLSDYICVGSLTLAGIEDGEYGQSEIDSLKNTIDALQERLVTGSERKKVPLLAYIGALNATQPAAQRQWVGLTDNDIQECYAEAYKIVQGRRLEVALGRVVESKLKEKNT